MATEKIMEKIKNLLDLANNNPNEHEAMAAALKAQELMAKYNVDLQQIEAEDPKEMFHAVYENNSSKHEMKKWKFGLANVVSKNFCCKTYVSGNSVVFYGYKKDAEIAVTVFKFLYESGNKFAVKYYNQCKKEGKNTRGVMNRYLQGFVVGIKEAFDKQCTALMIVVPKEVSDSFDVMTAGWKTKYTHMSVANDVQAYNQGKIDGKNAAETKKLA